MWRNTVKRGGTCKNLWDFLCMINVYDSPSYGDCYVEYMWVNIRCMLDWIIGFGHKILVIWWHECSTSQCTKWDAVMAGRDELSENSSLLLGLAFDSTTWWNKDLCTRSRTENGASKTVKEWEYWILTWLHAS